MTDSEMREKIKQNMQDPAMREMMGDMNPDEMSRDEMERMMARMGEAKPMKDLQEEALAYFGDTVKALGNGKVGGYLVRHSGETDPDLTADFFDAKTDIQAPDVLPVLYQHGFDEHMGKRVLGKAKTGRDDVGLWIEAQLDMRDEYEKAIYALAEKGKLGWSSGALSHLVEREPAGKAMHIKTWFIGEASLTPTPAEPRNSVVPLKSIIPGAAVSDREQEGEVSNAAQTAKENIEMNEELKAVFGEFKAELISELKTEAATVAKTAVNEVLDGLPEVKAAMNGSVQVTVAEEDRPFKTIGENLIAVANAALGKGISPRVRGLKALELKAALGSNEAVPSQGEFLLEPTITRELMKPVHESGIFTAKARRLPVGPNSNSGWIPGVDETSRATGSRWGGVRGYHAAEAGSMTASQPKFRKINWELHKTYVLQYATDELLSDAGMLSAIINQSAAEELDFLMNDDLLNGTGGDRPVGVLQSGALISIARQATSTIGHTDILNMWQRMLPRNRANAVWFVNSEAEPQLDALTFTAGTTGILSPYVRYDASGVMNIKGRPVVVTEFNPALGTAGDILLADMGEYLMWEKGAIEAAMSIHVQFLTDQTAFRFIARYDGQTALASAITPYKGTATQSPFVCLLATT